MLGSSEERDWAKMWFNIAKDDGPLESQDGCDCYLCEFGRQVHDPARLAELIQAESKRLGLEGWNIMDFAGKVLCCFRRKLGAPVCESDTRDMDLEWARRVLSHWIQLPDGDKERAELALRSSS